MADAYAFNDGQALLTALINDVCGDNDVLEGSALAEFDTDQKVSALFDVYGRKRGEKGYNVAKGFFMKKIGGQCCPVYLSCCLCDMCAHRPSLCRSAHHAAQPGA
jgi:hypothetical protein